MKKATNINGRNRFDIESNRINLDLILNPGNRHELFVYGLADENGRNRQKVEWATIARDAAGATEPITSRATSVHDLVWVTRE
jgi:hypothetical protein